MRFMYLVLAPALLSGCATDFKAVREFADETKKISVAFEPIINGAVEQCRQHFLQRRIYTTDKPLGDFDPQAAINQANDTCKPIAEENATAQEMRDALADYAEQLSALAADGVASSVDDNYDALSAKLGKFNALPKEKVDAVTALLKFITRKTTAQAQHNAIVDALNHEEAIGALADALVIYSTRVYSAYIQQRLKDQPLFIEQLRAEAAAPISSRLRIMDVYQQNATLQEQHQATIQLQTAVNQMKISLRELRQNADKLSNKEKLAETKKLAKEVKSLYKQLHKAF